jgi:hypothetical protein
VAKEDRKEMMTKQDISGDQNLNDAGKEWCPDSVHIIY